MLDVMAGTEPGDPFTAPRQTPSFLDSTEIEPRALRIGLLTESDKWIDPQVVAAVHQLTTLPPMIGQLTALEALYLHDNPALGLPSDNPTL